MDTYGTTHSMYTHSHVALETTVDRYAQYILMVRMYIRVYVYELM